MKPVWRKKIGSGKALLLLEALFFTSRDILLKIKQKRSGARTAWEEGSKRPRQTDSRHTHDSVFAG